MGINPERNRFAAVTNYRDGPDDNNNEPVLLLRSRGSLPVDFLMSDLNTMSFLSKLHNDDGARYNDYNMIAFDGRTLGYLSNRSDGPQRIVRGGIYGLSNHLLDTKWPKLSRGKAFLERYLNEELSSASDIPDQGIFDFLLDTTLYPDEDLPDTGVGKELERAYAPLFVHHEGTQYGTRCSTLVVVDASGPIRFAEKTYVPEGLQPDTITFDF